jgi:hypothetical protein
LADKGSRQRGQLLGLALPVPRRDDLQAGARLRLPSPRDPFTHQLTGAQAFALGDLLEPCEFLGAESDGDKFVARQVHWGVSCEAGKKKGHTSSSVG